MFEKIIYSFLYIWVSMKLPWFLAKVYIGFQEYHEHGHYKERVGIVGSFNSIEMFLNFSEWDFYYRRAVKRDPSLRWKRFFNPWSFEMPPLLETAGQAGI